MKHVFIKISLFSLLLMCISTVWAANNSQYLLTEKTYKDLQKAQTLMAEDKNNAAETKLKALLTKVTIKSYEMAVVQQTLAYLYSLQGQYKKASELFQQALYSKALPKKVSHNLRYNLAQLLLADGQYKKGIATLEKWFNNEKSPPNNAHVLIATAYYRVQNYKNTIKHIQIAINNDISATEAWHNILLSAHLQLKQYNYAIKVLENLITYYPHKTVYWTQLSSLYLQENKEFIALSVKMLAQRLEMDNPKTLMNIINMYRYLHIPYKSAQILKMGIDEKILKTNTKNLTKLADSWVAAKEAKKAAKIYKQLTTLDMSGQSDLKYGQVLFDLEQWKPAAKSLFKSLNKLKGDKIGQALLLLGVTQFQLGHLSQAKKTFNKAGKFKKQRNQVIKWSQYINRRLKEEAS